MYHIFIPCLPLEMSTYWQSLGWLIVLRIWNRPRILMELGVRGRPLLPQTSWGRAEAKNVKAPSCASLRGLILTLGRELVMGTTELYYLPHLYAEYTVQYKTLWMTWTSAQYQHGKHIAQYLMLDIYRSNLSQYYKWPYSVNDQYCAYSRLMDSLCSHLDRISSKSMVGEIRMNFFSISAQLSERDLWRNFHATT